MTTVLNFNAGPAMLPAPVLAQVQAELLDYQGRGMSIMEMSHRSTEFEAINTQAEATFKRLLGVDADYRVVFLQGGASTQFAMVPLNFLPPGASADFLMTGAWAEKAFEEVAALGKGRVAASTQADGYRRVPRSDEIELSNEPAYAHFVRSLAERRCTDLRHWSTPQRGGHFMAHEEPAQVASELRSFFRPLRPA